MITAFSEQLLTIDEMRTRMPDLAAQENKLRNQIQAIDGHIGWGRGGQRGTQMSECPHPHGTFGESGRTRRAS